MTQIGVDSDAVEAAEAGHDVFLLEREAYLGGRVARLKDVRCPMLSFAGEQDVQLVVTELGRLNAEAVMAMDRAGWK